MAYLLPRLPMLPDILGMPMAQLQAYCRAWEIPTTGQKIDDMRNNLRVLRLLIQGDPQVVTTAEAQTLYDAWDLWGDYSVSAPDTVKVMLIGYAAALGMRANAIGYCRTGTTITNKQPDTAFIGTGECDISVSVEETEP